jgi:hypothetical protein
MVSPLRGICMNVYVSMAIAVYRAARADRVRHDVARYTGR